MQKLSIIFFLIINITHSNVHSQLNPSMPITSNVENNNTHVIETYKDYYSYIDWTDGMLVTKYKIPITYNDINIGRNIINLTEKLKDRMIQYTIGTIKKLRISSIFVLNDFFQQDEDIKYQVLAILYDRPIENPIINKSFLSGEINIPLFGQKSITKSLYRNIQQKKITNYLHKETTGTQFYDTLIIDAVMFANFKASLTPQILDHTGKMLYSIETVSSKVLQQRGPIQYVTSITEALEHPMRGDKVAYILPKSTSGTFSSDLILFEEDVYRIFGQQRTINQLNQGRVIVIIPKESTL